MRRHYEIIGILTALSVGATLLAGCGSKEPREAVTITLKVPTITLTPPFDEEVTTSYDFLVKASRDFAAQYADAEVTFNILQFEPTAQTAMIEDCFDTADAADILYADFFNSESYVHTGRVVPLDDIITDEIRADIDEAFWDLCEVDGRTYLMPYLYRQNVLGYNQDLFRACGLEEYCSDGTSIQTWTMDEWEEILQTLYENLPDNSYAIMLYAANNQGDTHIMSYIRSQGSSFYDDDGRFHLDTEEGIAGLSWLYELEEKGYTPGHPDKLEILDNSDLFINGQLALYVVNDATESLYDFDLGFVNFPSIDGGISTNFNTGFEVFDNGDETRLAAAKAFVQYIYESDWLDYSAGSIPCSHRVAQEYADDLGEVQKYLGNAATGVNFTGNNPNWVGVRAAFYPNIQRLLSGEYTPAEAAAHLDADCNAAIEEGYANASLHE